MALQSSLLDGISYGISNLHAVEYEGAAKSFRSALKEMLKSVDLIAPRVGDEVARNEEVGGLVFRSEQVNLQSIDHNDHHAIKFYDRTISVSAKDGQVTSSQGIWLAALTLYNLGLTHHLVGAQRVKSKTTNYKKAVNLYKHGLELIEHAAPTGNGGLLILALTNNLAHIHASHFQFYEVGTYLQQMHYTLDFEADEEEYIHFRLNLLVAEGHYGRPSPAA